MRDLVTSFAGSDAPYLLEVDFEARVSKEDRHAWWRGLMRLAEEQGIELGTRETETGFALAFHSQRDADRLCHLYDDQEVAFADAYRARILDRYRRMRGDQVRTGEVRAGLPPPEPEEQ